MIDFSSAGCLGLLSIVRQHPNGITSFKLAKIASGRDTTGVVNEVRNRMLEHERCYRIRVVQTLVDKVYFCQEAP